MQKAKEAVDVGVYNWLPNQRQRAVSDAFGFLQPLGQYAGQAAHGLDQVLVVVHEAANKEFRGICLPSPLRAHGIFVVPPAEHTLVGAREGGGGLHALVGGYAVEGVLVAAATAPQHALCPPA